MSWFFPLNVLIPTKIPGKLNALSLLSSLLEIPGFFSLVFKNRKGCAQPIHSCAIMLNFNVSKVKPNKTSEYLESTTKSLGYFLLQLSGQVVFCVCLSFPNLNM